MDKQDTKNLKRRYLTWLYKTTKEALDRIERKFTQLDIDKFILKELKKQDRDKRLTKFIDEFKVYIQNKEKEGLSLKYFGKEFPAPGGSRYRREKPDYQFLVMKLSAIEKAIIKELGNKALKEIKSLYENEMMERILKSAERK